MDKNYQGKGIGREVSKIALDYIFKELKFFEVILTVSELHEKAIKLYESLGFEKTNLVPNDREIFLNGKWIQSGTVEMKKII